MDKDKILSYINIESEITDLLGQGKQHRWKCFRSDAHKDGDSSPSLSISDKGYWRCHVCQIGGDLFQLYMDVKGISRDEFRNVLEYFAKKYNVNVEEFDKPTQKGRSISERKILEAAQVNVDMKQDIFDLMKGKKETI